MKSKKVTLKIPKRPGPKPKPEAEKAKALNVSFPIDMYKILKKHPCRSAYIQGLIKQDKSYQDFLEADNSG